MSGKSDQNITGYKYSLSILMGLCRGPVEMIVQIKVGEMVAWTGPLIQGAVQIPIYQPQLFGGDEAEGGIVGGFDFYDGNAAQVIPDTTKQIISSTNMIAVATTDGATAIPLAPVDKNAGDDDTDDAPSSGSPTIPVLYQLESVPVPDLRGVSTLWYDGQVCSNNPYPKEWKIRVRRALAGWDGDPWYPEACVVPMQDSQALATAATDQSNVQADAATDDLGNGGGTTNTTPATTAILLPESGSIYAMNPAHVLYECITNRVWGRGLDRTLIDDPSFTAGANWLLQEGFGVCLKWSKSDDLSTFIQHLLDTMGAVLFTSRLTGLLTLKMIRNDYNVSELMTLDYSSGLLVVEDASNNSQSNLVNEIIVKWHSPVSNTDRQCRCQDLASIQSQGSVYSQTNEYPGIPTPDLALRVAQRDLAAIAWGVKTYVLTCDRRAYKIQPGDCFSLSAPDRGIASTTLRLLKLEDSTLTDETIKLTAAQDVFALPLTSFNVQQKIVYNPPNRDPQPVTYHRLVEMTYRDLYLKLSAQDLANLGPSQTGFMDFAATPTTMAIGFRMLVTADGGVTYANNGIHVFPFFVRLVNKIGMYDTSIKLTGFSPNFNYALPACLLIDDEFLRVDALDVYTGVATVARGCVDSTPQRHAAGAVVWFNDTGQSDGVEYAAGETVSVLELTRTTKGTLPQSQAPAVTVTLIGRQERPYPPANVTVNGPYAVDSDSGQWTITAADLTINFARRNRITLGDIMAGFSDPDMVPETGQTTTVRVRRMSDNVVVGTYPGITGTQFIYTQAQAISDGAFGLIQLELYSVIGTTTSRYPVTYPVNYYPAGAVPAPPTGQPASRVGIEQCLYFLTSVLTGTLAVTASLTSAFRFYNAGMVGSVTHVSGPKTDTLALTARAYGSTLGGVYHEATILLTAADQGSAPATGTSQGSFVFTAVDQGDIREMNAVGHFVMTGLATGYLTPLPGSYGYLTLSAVQTGMLVPIVNGTLSSNLALTSIETGSLTPISTGTMASNFAFNASSGGVSEETGQDYATGTSTGNFALTNGGEAGKMTVTGASTGNMRLTAIEASSQIAACYQTANFALTNGGESGTVAATGSSTGNVALTSAEAGTAQATGTSTGNMKLTSVEAGSDTATGTSTGNFALTDGGETGTVQATGTSTGNFTFTNGGETGTVAAAGGYSKSYATKYGS